MQRAEMRVEIIMEGESEATEYQTKEFRIWGNYTFFIFNFK